MPNYFTLDVPRGVNKAICIYNTYHDERAKADRWDTLPGVIGDMTKMTKMLEEGHYDVRNEINQDNIENCIARVLWQWKDEKINRLHFHFSGHGIHNQTVETHRNDLDEVDSSTPIGECLVGNMGDRGLCSVLRIQELLTYLDPDRITISLDCCRTLDRPREKTRERVKLAEMPRIEKHHWRKIATIQASCKTLPSYDMMSFTNELLSVYNRHKGHIPIDKMDELVNNSWYERGIDQLCQMEIVRVGDNWKNLYWPI